MKINDKQFYNAVLELKNYEDKNAYVSDLALSSMWLGEDVDRLLTDTEIEEIINFLNDLWEVGKNGTKYIRGKLGISQLAFCKQNNIPHRTLAQWETTNEREKRKCPLYVLIHLAQINGVLPISTENNVYNMDITNEVIYGLIYIVSHNYEDNDKNAFIKDGIWELKIKNLYNEKFDKEINDFLSEIWEVGKNGIKYIREKLGISQLAFSQKFCVPLRTVESWETTNEREKRKCPLYVLVHLAQVGGVLPYGRFSFRQGK